MKLGISRSRKSTFDGLHQFGRPGRYGRHSGVNSGPQDDVGHLVVAVAFAQDLLERVFRDVLLGPGGERPRDVVARLGFLLRHREQLAAVVGGMHRRVGLRRRDDLLPLG